ncbi:hypothetical protein DE146DRAFT_776200 [Phaeosphaeria sp. MPI-PUGE-AT-0046c]|nr:hypothetical protein DE146DRAFT_776200 [Phaeosphaeria sp. MPI-PUGE-AT-0046c]
MTDRNPIKLEIAEATRRLRIGCTAVDDNYMSQEIWISYSNTTNSANVQPKSCSYSGPHDGASMVFLNTLSIDTRVVELDNITSVQKMSKAAYSLWVKHFGEAPMSGSKKHGGVKETSNTPNDSKEPKKAAQTSRTTERMDMISESELSDAEEEGKGFDEEIEGEKGVLSEKELALIAKANQFEEELAAPPPTEVIAQVRQDWINLSFGRSKPYNMWHGVKWRSSLDEAPLAAKGIDSTAQLSPLAELAKNFKGLEKRTEQFKAKWGAYMENNYE